jgi:hypothetical protein
MNLGVLIKTWIISTFEIKFCILVSEKLYNYKQSTVLENYLFNICSSRLLITDRKIKDDVSILLRNIGNDVPEYKKTSGLLELICILSNLRGRASK